MEVTVAILLWVDAMKVKTNKQLLERIQWKAAPRQTSTYRTAYKEILEIIFIWWWISETWYMEWYKNI